MEEKCKAIMPKEGQNMDQALTAAKSGTWMDLISSPGFDRLWGGQWWVPTEDPERRRTWLTRALFFWSKAVRPKLCEITCRRVRKVTIQYLQKPLSSRFPRPPSTRRTHRHPNATSCSNPIHCLLKSTAPFPGPLPLLSWFQPRWGA